MQDKWRNTARFFNPTTLKWSPRSLIQFNYGSVILSRKSEKQFKTQKSYLPLHLNSFEIFLAFTIEQLDVEALDQNRNLKLSAWECSELQ